MTLTDIIEQYLRNCPGGATTSQIQMYCHSIGYVNQAECEVKNISGICSHKCTNGGWYKKRHGNGYLWSIYPL